MDPAVVGDLRIETIVVDNASTDGSAEAAREQGSVTVVALPRNIGYGRANNLGFERG
jgi:GT2 family glycosyltransferase